MTNVEKIVYEFVKPYSFKLHVKTLLEEQTKNFNSIFLKMSQKAEKIGETKELLDMEKELLKKFMYESTNQFIAKEIRKIIQERE